MCGLIGILSPLRVPSCFSFLVSPSALLFFRITFCSGRRHLQGFLFLPGLSGDPEDCLCEPVVLGSLCVCHSVHWLVFVGVIVEWCFIMSSQDVAQKHKQQPPEALDPRWV